MGNPKADTMPLACQMQTRYLDSSRKVMILCQGMNCGMQCMRCYLTGSQMVSDGIAGDRSKSGKFDITLSWASEDFNKVRALAEKLSGLKLYFLNNFGDIGLDVGGRTPGPGEDWSDLWAQNAAKSKLVVICRSDAYDSKLGSRGSPCNREYAFAKEKGM